LWPASPCQERKTHHRTRTTAHDLTTAFTLRVQAGMGFKSPVFHYSFGQDPSHPFCLMPDWCAKYALHALEMVRCSSLLLLLFILVLFIIYYFIYT
jgi:hypothetical protein